MSLNKEIKKFAELLQTGEDEAFRAAGGFSSVASIERLPGDASTRRYYRVKASDGATTILMKMEPFPTLAENLPFLAVQKLLSQNGVDAPRVLDFDPPTGMIWLEDLGDVTLLRRLQDVSETEVERHIYERVIDGLVQMQVHATPRLNPNGKLPPLECFKIKFDHEKLMWETQFTVEHFYEKHLKRELKDADRKLMLESFSEICRFLESQPTVFTHRDFHSRNIMAAPSDRWVMIDFQDARMGPPQYDLVSLLKDSYYQLDENQIQRLLDYYIARYEAQAGEKISKEAFTRTFDLMGVQRNFKAIGSFASFLNLRGNPGYLKFIGNTFENIRRALLRYHEYARLREVLFHYYYF